MNNVSRQVLVIIESPFAGDVATNKQYLHAACRDSINRGEAPFASHGFYTYFFDDTVLSEREIGIACGYAWMEVATIIAFYIDLGMSPGMIRALEHCMQMGYPFELRRLGSSWQNL